MRKLLFTALLALFILVTTNNSDAGFRSRASDKFITIGTGSITGVYYPAGGAICRLVNRGRRNHGIRCTVESTAGSIDNIMALRSGQFDIAVAQSDWQHHAVKGTDAFEQYGPMEKMRSIFSLHSEPLTLVVRDKSDIKTFDDLKGKVVNLGEKGSGMRATMEFVMQRLGWTTANFKKVAKIPASSQARALCDGEIDVMIYTAGHPNGAVQEVTNTCDARIIPVNGKAIDKIVKDNPFYTYTYIPGGMYIGNNEDIKTIGVKATFVTTKDLDDEIVYQVTKSVFNNFDKFRMLHPVFTILDKESLVTEGNTATIHSGAQKYFKEVGLVK